MQLAPALTESSPRRRLGFLLLAVLVAVLVVASGLWKDAPVARLDRALLAEHIDALRPGTSRGYLYQLLAGAGWTSWLWLPQIRIPVLIVMGADDPIVPEVNGRMLAKRLPDARLKVVDCGHLFILTQPEMTAKMVEQFILDHEPARAGG